MTLDELLKRPAKGPRFTFITDLHAQSRSPKMRKDNYREVLLEKLTWCCEATNKLGAAKQMLCGGDVFNVARVNLDVADDLVDVIIENSCELHTVFGNHDLENSLSTAPSTVLGHLMRRSSGAIRALPILGSRPFILEGIHIWGHHYRHMNHLGVLESPIIDPEAPRVIVSHSMILDKKPVWPDGEYCLFEDVVTNAQLVLLGHYHPQQLMQRLDNAYGTLIGGPGALMRGSLSRDNLTRWPAMAVCEWHAEAKDFIVDFIPVECAQPAEAIFRIEEAIAENERSDAMDDFRDKLDDMKVQADSVGGIIERIAKQDGISEEIKEESLRRIGAI